ncbi:hypothetical protein T4B_5859 [Trichinella pseudospiralis]|nr:hypothetical protein T4B_5859 [Trichinella pseudospiralis]KRZ41750.1 hypothetical protein T4C_8779 [Trichinella pseudospiralis]
MSKAEASSLPKKLDLGKRRLIKLLEELDQLLKKRAAVEQCQEVFETTLDDDQKNTKMEEFNLKAIFEHMCQSVDALKALGEKQCTLQLTVADR